MKKPTLKITILLTTLFLLFGLSSLAACNFSPVKSYIPTEEATAFVPPTRVPTSTPTPLPTPTALPMEEDCTNYLSYIDDLTVLDGYEADPGEVLDKQWKVRNGGTCNWGPGYTLKVMDNEGDVDVPESMALYPALKDADAIIRVIFTAPEEEGEYTIQWKAFDPDGTSFNEFLSVYFIVKSPTE